MSQDVGRLGEEVGRLNQDVVSTRHHAEDVKSEVEALKRWAVDRESASTARTDNEFKKLWERLDFIRKETLLELKYNGCDQVQLPEQVAARIINGDRVNKLGGRGLKLNLGCGHLPLENYVNVDQRELPGVDIVLLIDGGVLRTITPDGEAMLKGIAEGTYPFADFREVLFGGQEYEGDFHYNLFTPESLSALLVDGGFGHVECVEKGRRNGACFEFEMIAHRTH
jgi:hypothetical protein